MNDKKIPSQKSTDDCKIEIPQNKSTTYESEIIGLRFSNEDGEQVYRQSENTLRMILWSSPKRALMRSRGWISDEQHTDDGLYS